MGGLSGEGKSRSELVRIQAAVARGEATIGTAGDLVRAAICEEKGCRGHKPCEKPDEGKSGCEAEREPDSPSPPNLEAALALVLGVACMALGANLDRISGAYRLSEGRIDIGLELDGRPLHPSEAAEVEQALRAVRGSGGAREKPVEGKSISPKPERPRCAECGRTLPTREPCSWGPLGCRVCGRKMRRP